ncbi:MAG TPA: hypothetical protein VG738_22715 [Chitinophagaceae bacterium]|nr:hypothetical protein [Chitinophagaceae bacterium]
MFTKIFLFELQYRLKRPAVYVYFLLAFLFTGFAFAKGAMPLDGKQLINGTYAIAFYTAIMSLMMMLPSSSIMGIPLYRDIEYNTKEYYLSYPITKAGYFWGRFLSSFLFVLIIDIAVPLGAYFGTKAGPAFGWELASRYGPNLLINYLHPFLFIAVPNLFFVSALFFGLVAATKNVKVIYTSGALLFLGYMIANFFIRASTSMDVIYLADPFVANGLNYEKGLQTVVAKNTSLVTTHGLLLWNRVLWTGVGAAILLYTYLRFNFERFFSGRRDKKVSSKPPAKYTQPAFNVSYSKGYARKTLYTLTKIEVKNIIRDTYFWLMIGGGTLFLGMVFWHMWGRFWVPDFPRTSMILMAFDNNFLVFIFCIIMFYTGETIHRERTTRYAFINDSLPPADYILNAAKFLSILAVAFFLTTMPMLIGISVQLMKGYTHINLPLYFTVLYLVVLPACIEMVMFAFAMHICINNKFAALGTGIALWVLFVLANQSGWMDYHLLLYSYTPNFGISDMDGIGHMLGPVSWFNLYWLLFGALLLLAGYLFYVRGTISSFRERWQLAKERFKGRTKRTAVVLSAAFIATAGYNYYNVSYVNSYYTRNENVERAAIAEKTMKHYEDMPLPSIINIKLYADIFPAEHKAGFKAYVTLVNKTTVPITQLLLDGDNISDYTLSYNGSVLSYTNPLIFKRGKFNFLKSKADSSAYRLYTLSKPLMPLDTAIAEVNSFKEYKGFGNYLFGTDILKNGTAIGPGLPGLGYDDDEELTDEDDRAKYGLPKKTGEFAGKNDTTGANYLLTGIQSGLLKFDIIISTSDDQIAVGPGDFKKHWQENGRNYFEYVSNPQGVYSGIGIFSARYTTLTNSVTLKDGKTVGIELLYHPSHNANLQRFMSAYKDGLKYYTNWGSYPFTQMRLAELSAYNRDVNSMAGTDAFSENFGWNANFTSPSQWDYCYYSAAQQLAKQWWLVQVAPNHTKGSRVITDGLSKYAAILMMKKKYGADNIRNIISSELDGYLWGRGRTVKDQNPLLTANRWNEWDNKVGIALYGLEDLIGEDSINTALREFYNTYAFKTKAPYAGSKDLYYYLKKHVPDSLQYYLKDTWEKITFYDNKVDSVTSTSLGNNKYRVSFTVSTSKTYEDSDGNETQAAMNDYIDIGVFAVDSQNKKGFMQTNPLYLQKCKLTQGEHHFEIIVTGKPASVGIDPLLKLIDKNPGDNIRGL